MSEIEATAGPISSSGSATRSGARFYVLLSIWMWTMAIAGFGPAYVSALINGEWIRSIAVHVHAIVYVVWLGLFTYQVNLPPSGNIAKHRRLGVFLVGYAILMIVVGLIVTFSRFADRVGADQLAAAQAAFIHPLSDMLIFPVVFALAVYYRRSPDTHKRLMVVATTVLLIAAVGRMSFLGSPLHPLIYDFVWLSPIWIAMLRDVVMYRLLHPVYVSSLLLLAAVPYRYLLVETQQYQGLTIWLADLL